MVPKGRVLQETSKPHIKSVTCCFSEQQAIIHNKVLSPSQRKELPGYF